MAPPARFELALPPPEGGALSPELRGLRQSAVPCLAWIERQCTSVAAADNSVLTSGRCPRSILDLVPGGWWSARVTLGAVLIMLVSLAGCVQQATPAPAVQRSTPPPWSAPRDAVAYIEAAGLEPHPVNSRSSSRFTELRVIVDKAPVEVPAYVGIDRVRAVQAAAHTHDTSGQIWLEGRGASDITLGQFFVLWGVQFDDHCLGSACGGVVVKIDGVVSTAPHEVRLSETQRIDISATS